MRLIALMILCTSPLLAGKYVQYPTAHTAGQKRVYENEVTPSEKGNVRYIVTTLANKSYTSIWGHQGALEEAGNRIDHLHPFRFLMCIFNDEELKVGLHNIHERGWIWSRFFDGMSSSLSAEKALGNLKPEYIEDFAKNVGIDSKKITPSIEAGNWSELISVLIKELPRKNNPGRYDL